ncbi:hypothetical protein L2E82_40323 [Cichorium intybus]|uniref:Uncharacterized protein n=1 Tax=Cichorium intybus TaxID=13427 RepID=A0ACB9AKT5_CICIN|nr:hypothetical protein L2E82_40323 [Cichorium intybus]
MIQTKESPLPTKTLVPKHLPRFSPKHRGTEVEIHAVVSPIIAIIKDKDSRYMGYHQPQQKEFSLDSVRESLIAISYCEPESFSHVTESKIPNGEHNIAVVATQNKVDTVIDELRLKLISIASYSPSMGCPHNNCNGYAEV